MPEDVPYSPGKRIAHYRRIAKISAEDLAEKAGFGLTRSIIANLENGRKEDLTVRQLMAIALVLGVSPVNLVFDVRRPYASVSITETDPPMTTAVWLARDWFAGALNVVELHHEYDGRHHPPPASDNNYNENLIVNQLRRRDRLLSNLGQLEKNLADQSATTADRESIRNIRAELYELDSNLRRLAVDLDNPISPGFPF